MWAGHCWFMVSVRIGLSVVCCVFLPVVCVLLRSFARRVSFPPPRNHAAAVAMCREHSNFEVISNDGRERDVSLVDT